MLAFLVHALQSLAATFGQYEARLTAANARKDKELAEHEAVKVKELAAKDQELAEAVKVKELAAKDKELATKDTKMAEAREDLRVQIVQLEYVYCCARSILLA